MTKKRRKRRNGSKWITVIRRYQIYKRDDLECFYCGAHKYDFAVKLSLDHINSDLIEKKGKMVRDNRSENLVCCCNVCNSKKGVNTLDPKTLEAALKQASKELPCGEDSLRYKNIIQLPLPW